MAATSEGPSNWNRPVAAAQTPQQNYVSDGWVPVTPNPVNSVAAAHFSNLDTANWNRPAQSIEVSGWSPAASSTPASASGTQWASGAPMRNALQSQLAIAQQGAASGWGLAENTPVTEPNGWLAPRSSSDQNHLQQDVSRLHFASARLDDDTRRDLRKARSTAQLEGSSSPLARNVLTPQPSSLSSNFHTGEGSPSKDKDTASSTPSMRLFNRSFNEVNKSLGLGTTDDVQLRRSSNRSERRGGEELAKAIGIYIYGINKGVRVQDILAVFSKYGDISNVGIVTKENREGRIYAYVDYEEVGSAAKAIADVRGKPLFGIKEPLELRPHFDRKVAAEDPASPPPKKEKDAAPASGSQKKEVASKKSGITTNSKDSAGASGSATPAAEGSADISNKRTLHIANVPQHIEKSELEKLFRPFGEIRRIHIVQRPKEKRAFAFISFRTEELAAKALAAVKVGKHLGMSEPLKIEFSKADQHKDKEKEKDKAKDKEKDKEKEKEKDATKSEKSTASEPAGSGKAGSKQRPTDKPWKKGADLEKLLEKPSQASQTSKQTPTAPAATSRKASGGRTTIYIRDVPDGTNLDDLKAKFTAIGPLRSFFAVEKVGAGSTGKCAVVAFEKGADAAKAVKDRVDGVIFPRQR
ncbi:hypothetical protein DFJ73DRAFT_269255 [Zopfochytrium polystomum]|nr:hypothetical protein DFJ73DRAFT_269255 [Zopfochytrium polystomum]